MTRTHLKHCRVYMNGVDISGYTRQIGALNWMFSAEPDKALTDECANILIGQGEIAAGPINAFLDNDAAGLHALAGTGSTNYGTKMLTVAIGANAAPALGDPVFSWIFEQTAYTVEQGSGFVAANVTNGGASYTSTLTYRRPWGHMLHPRGAETAVNTAIGADDIGASSALGGIFWYHIFSANGTATVKAQHAGTNANGSFSDLTGATSGSVDASASPKYGMVALSTSLSISRYTRWQIVLGTATTLNFTCGLIRNNLA